jgi:6-pyruvoyltetrahydropterin/6-carboxytetrahydropterin synthase
MRVKVNRKAHFNSAHRLYNPSWTEEKNQEIFGLCNNPNFHGHNYNLIVSVTGEVDPETGYVIDMKVLKNVIAKHVTAKLDHKNLNVEVAEFKTLIPTAENIAIVCYNWLIKELPTNLDVKVTLFETERNWVEYPV